jgi:hypothetical protein
MRDRYRMPPRCFFVRYAAGSRGILRGRSSPPLIISCKNSKNSAGSFWGKAGRDAWSALIQVQPEVLTCINADDPGPREEKPEAIEALRTAVEASEQLLPSERLSRELGLPERSCPTFEEGSS